MATDPKICARRGKPVMVNAGRYDVFEGMHWLCFHLEFEHQGDPDAPCSDPSCPWWRVAVFRRRLEKLGENPQLILDRAIEERSRSSGQSEQTGRDEEAER